MAHGLLPRGQALRSPPLADSPCGPYATFGISAAFAALSPPSGQIAHAFLALPPLRRAVLLHPAAVRLACLIHAASVRSEPESNSQEKKSTRFHRPKPRDVFRSVQIASTSFCLSASPPDRYPSVQRLSFGCHRTSFSPRSPLVAVLGAGWDFSKTASARQPPSGRFLNFSSGRPPRARPACLPGVP